tara:strand:+ start:97 stop:459 length:363 start_codon:yes stop_codon:yes gene_type:complete
MLNEEDCYMLGANFHTRKFKALFNVSLRKEEEESEEDFEARKAAATAQQAAIEENLIIFPDGTIFGVRKTMVDSYFKDEDVQDVRWGRRQLPKRLVMENADDLYKLLAAVVPLDETVNYG